MSEAKERLKHKRTRQLGVNPSTASAKLRKMIMFQMVQELGRDVCFQCGEKIEAIEEFSIEHKKPWLHEVNAKELFFSLDNIAFSHMRCNRKAARYPKQKSKIFDGKQKCTKCGEIKTIEMFGREARRVSHSEIAGVCLECGKLKSKNDRLRRKIEDAYCRK